MDSSVESQKRKEQARRMLEEIFVKWAKNRELDVRNQNIHFVHYTNADSALKIIKGQEFWLREPTSMDDYREVLHGLDCLTKAWDTPNGTFFKNALDSVASGMSEALDDMFRSNIDHFFTDIYIACFSEHQNDPQNLGRLSMWRAYGGKSGVALVFRNQEFFENPGTKLITVPVEYVDDAQIGERLRDIGETILENRDAMKGLEVNTVLEVAYYLLWLIALSSKHPGFQEEREWRVIYSPKYGRTNLVKRDVVAIDGIAQTIFRVSLAKSNDKTGAELSKLLDRIIIGPTAFPVASKQAFVRALEDSEVIHPQGLVHLSNIPLRS